MKILHAILFIACISMSNVLVAQVETPHPSPFCKVEQKVGLTDVTIEYSRPSMKDRQIFGELVPFDKKWRTGANKNTILTFSTDVEINGNQVKKGSYALFTKPGATSWTVYLYSDTENWGVPSEWDDTKVAAQFDVTPKSLPLTFETFLINVSNLRNASASIQLVWDRLLVSMELTVPTEKLVEQSIDKTMAGPSANDYYNAAKYYLQEGKSLDVAEDYIAKAVEKKEKFWILRTQAQILAKNGKYNEAIKVASKSMQLAKEAGYDNYVKMNIKSIAEWKLKK